MSHPFETVSSSREHPLRVLAVGAGAMGRNWMAVVQASPEAELVGVVDIDTDAAHEAVSGVGRPDLPVGTDVVALAEATHAQAVLNITIPAAHHPVTTAALFAGLPVLSEKPVADTLSSALSLMAAAQVTGQLFMVSQSRRWNPHVAALREVVAGLGPVGTVTTEFFRAPHFGGFREHMPHPLLVDMAIHPFDTARYVLGSDPVSVYCQAFNPPWSWYGGDANAVAVFEMEGGARYVYTGSWCAPGAETSWNGAWRVSARNGTVRWDGENHPTADADPPPESRPPSPYSGIGGAFQIFCEALRSGTVPMGEVHENVMSLAMVEGAIASAEAGRPVLVDEVFADALTQALGEESHPQVRAAMQAWPSVRSVTLQPRDPSSAPDAGRSGAPEDTAPD